MKTMSGVIVKGSVASIVTYVVIGVFGYLCFTTYPNPDFILRNKNILAVEIEIFRRNPAIIIVNIDFKIIKGNFTLLIAVISASPLIVLPAKDTIEELVFRKKKMTKK